MSKILGRAPGQAGTTAAAVGRGRAMLFRSRPLLGAGQDPTAPTTTSLLARLYFATHRALEKLVVGLSACFSGVWLGVLPRRVLYSIDAIYYDRQRYYRTEDYNRRGLWPWEQRVIETHFAGCRSLLVGAAGGGREVLALRTRGLEVQGFECHPGLTEFANQLLSKDGYAPDIRLALRDTCPGFGRTYDGLIVGWGAYMLIRGRRRRIEFLRQLRKHAELDAPLLLSFFYRARDSHRYQVAAAIGTALALVRRGERVEVGDFLAPNFVHYFTREELAGELRAGDFELVHFGKDEYGHAVARAS
ncbi:MAG: SAM-dependent methyltransferase [Gemmatimonadales bacterium]